jgi:hypothetical protein
MRASPPTCSSAFCAPSTSSYLAALCSAKRGRGTRGRGSFIRVEMSVWVRCVRALCACGGGGGGGGGGECVVFLCVVWEAVGRAGPARRWGRRGRSTRRSRRPPGLPLFVYYTYTDFHFKMTNSPRASPARGRRPPARPASCAGRSPPGRAAPSAPSRGSAGRA